MVQSYWYNGFIGWGWLLWFGFIFLMLSSFGNWGYTYRAHQRFSGRPENRSFDILDERYARGDISREDYLQLKADSGGGSAIVAGRGRTGSNGRASGIDSRAA